MIRVTIKETERTRPVGISGLHGWIERRLDDLFYVLIWDKLSGGLAGSYKLSESDFEYESDEQHAQE